MLGRAGVVVDTASAPGEALACLGERAYRAMVANGDPWEFPPLDWLAAPRGAAPTIPLVLCADARTAWALEAVQQDFRPLTVLAMPCAPENLVAAVKAPLILQASQPGLQSRRFPERGHPHSVAMIAPDPEVGR